jgi:hypothetical protein
LGAAGGDGGIASATATLSDSTAPSSSSDATATGGNAGTASSGGSGSTGGAGGGANAAATTTENGGAAAATAAATAGNSAASVGGNGIDGTTILANGANAAATGVAATATASATGGDGGTATGASNTGGNGASLAGLAFASDSAVATATGSSGVASAEADATGGAGGAGSAGAQGGAGGNATLTDAVVGTSSGPVTLLQNATGGAGGSSTDTTGTGGAGGGATSTITPPGAPTVNPLTATVNATGGVGGSGATGNTGGAATATIDTVTAGTTTATNGVVVTQNANATAGDGGSSTTVAGGAGGNATASDTGTASGGIGAFSVESLAVAGSGGSGTATGANGTATATSTANTVSSAVSTLAPGTAYAQSTAWAQSGGASTTLGSGTATATAETANGLLANGFAEATGGAGTVTTTAITSGGLILTLNATSGAPTNGETFAGATAEENVADSGPSNASDNAYAAAGGLAQFSNLATLAPNVAAVFSNPAMVNFGTGSFGAVYSPNATGAQVYTSSISWDVNGASLPAGGILYLGLVSPVTGSGGLTSLTFMLTEDGTVVDDQTFPSATAANSYFTNTLAPLGTVSAGDLNVTASLSETLDGTGNAYGVDFTVGVAPPCFAAGTRILTTRGEVRVEDLRVGDCAVSGFGGCSEIIWTGHREVDCARHPVPAEVWPVRICAGAFGDGMPARLLRVSPDHAVFVASTSASTVEGVLIPAKYLVNGTTVTQEAAASITYWHVECAKHEVLLAEGLPTESYLDTGNRGGFAEAGVVSLFPDFGIGAREVWERFGCRPLVEAGPALDAARAHLAARAAALGFAPVAFQRVELDQVGSVQVAVPAGVERLHLLSACRVPDGERRRLGAAVAAISLDGVSLWDEGPDSGFYPVEQSAGGMYRWTDGEGVLRVAPADWPRMLEVSVVMLVRPQEAERRTA